MDGKFQRRYEAALNLGMSEDDALYYANLSLIKEGPYAMLSESLAEVPALKAENATLKARVDELEALNAELALALRGLLSLRSVNVLEEATREYPHGKEDVIDEVGAFDFARNALTKHKGENDG